jgi:hypothetical protein
LKKLFAISLLSLLLFNLTGYRILFNYLESNAQTEMEAVLDKHSLNNADLFEIKVPIRLPYFNDVQSFERIDGSLEMNGIFYNYVERKISNDTLILVCTPNTEENKIDKAKGDYANVNDCPQNTSGSKTNTALFNLLMSEFNDQNISWEFALENSHVKMLHAVNDNPLKNAYLTSPEQPPEII